MQLRKREKGGCENKTFEMTHGESIGAEVVGSSRTPSTCTICVFRKRLKHEKLQKIVFKVCQYSANYKMM